ncbi:hypothetical protein B0J11DRAFT_530330 [Dendryphion nanum]|uniref:Uncharacterized protein n=1 Tax=Dendryphion nanum TaxID=256645 RepID=A0A9P9IKM4_9PLEO|nr:hypothetical protein B0J11DRAFT_530330 [Dendryphion nanum]
MAQVIAPAIPSNKDRINSNPQNAAPHGKKRAADSSLENEQRLSKRFDLLNLVDGTGTRLYIPVSPSSSPSPSATTTTTTKPHSPQRLPSSHHKPRRPASPSSSMHLDETPHKIYIHDLAAELSDIESDSETPIFLPDIEAHIAKIPKHVLRAKEPEELKTTKENQLVLWSGVGEEESERVRRAIWERGRRERIERLKGGGGGLIGVDVNVVADASADADADAMDLD